MKNCAVIIAPEKTESMKSSKPDALCEILFKPMLEWVITAVKKSSIDDIFVIAGEHTECVAEKLGDSVTAVCVKIDDIADTVKNYDNAVILQGNRPFTDSDTIFSALSFHTDNKNDITKINVNNIYTEISCIRTSLITNADDTSTNKTGVFTLNNDKILLTAETRSQLNKLNELAREEVLEKLMDDGVDIPCKDGIIVSPDCTVGKDTRLLPNTIICGDVTIGENCVIGPNSYICNAQIGDDVIFNNGQIRNAKILERANIGPFVQIRPDSVIGDGVHLGNFVEVKNSTIDSSTSVSHLTYVGDSDVGKNVNFGCGVVTVNFNGKTKNRTTIKDRAFIGCNTNLVAPVTVGECSYTAAGSTITEDVPDNTLAIARERQTNKEGWVKKNQPYRKKV